MDEHLEDLQVKCQVNVPSKKCKIKLVQALYSLKYQPVDEYSPGCTQPPV